MKRILLVLLLMMSLLHAAEGVKTKKLIIKVFKEKQAAQRLYKELSRTYYMRTVSKEYGLKLLLEHAEGHYFLVMKPFRNETLLLAVAQEVRKEHPGAYLKRYYDTTPGAPDYVLGPMPVKKSMQAVPKAPMPKVSVSAASLSSAASSVSSVATPKEQTGSLPQAVSSAGAHHLAVSIPEETPLLSKEESTPYLRSEKHIPDTTYESNALLYAVLGGTAVSAGVLLFFWRRKRRTTRHDASVVEYLLEGDVGHEHTVDKSLAYCSSSLYVDLHSHLIPGIDDGAKTMEESIELIRKLKALGYKKLITTPHIMAHRYDNDKKTILQGLETLKVQLRHEGIEIAIEAAAEYYLDDQFLSLLEKRDVMTFGANFVLFEMSYVNHPANLFEIVNTIKDAGYKPVLAHPERYLFMNKSFEKYERLKSMGVYFQLNLNSLSGYYSPEVQKVAIKLVDHGMVDFLGSDTHKMRQALTLESVMASPLYKEIFTKNQILNNVL